MEKTVVMGIQIETRTENAVEVQKLLTEYGCIIKTRLGLHETEKGCSPTGLVLLVFASDAGGHIDVFERKLKAISGVKVNKMEF
jgi:hypothetical protein